MRVQSVASPHAIPQVQSSEAASKARAVAAFNKAANPAPEAPQAHAGHSPSLNQNAISPEDMSAIKAPTRQASPSPAPDVVEEAIETLESVETEAPKVEAKQPDPRAVQEFERLKRMERQARVKQQEAEQRLKQREDAIKAREQELTAKDNQYKQGYYAKDQIQQNALQVLAEAGVSYDDLVQQIVNQTPQDPRMSAKIGALEAQIAKLSNALENNEKSYQEQQAQSYQAAVKQISSDVSALVKSDPAYEAIRTAKATKDVVDLIEQTYKQDGVLLTVEEAATEVENYLVEEALKFTRLGKIQKRLQETQAASKPQQKTQDPKPQQPQPMKTLTNAASGSRQLSARERALLAFKGELKS